VVEADPDKDFAEAGKGQISDTCDSPPAVVDGMIVFRTDEGVLAVGAK
jgi:hypothetical protein